MRKKFIFTIFLITILYGFILTGCVVDLEYDEIPSFVEEDFIDLTHIRKVSKFRSGWDRDFSDWFETNRSMKHYYFPKKKNTNVITLRAPIDGQITRIKNIQGSNDKIIDILSDQYQSVTFIIFRVKLKSGIQEGNNVVKGQELGTTPGPDKGCEIAVKVNSSKGFRYISYFQVISMDVFRNYMNYGAVSRDQFIITRQDRDADPLECKNKKFLKQERGEKAFVRIKYN